jgi:hypothetical protein
MMFSKLVAAGIALVSLATAGCSPRAIRGGEGTARPELDEPALSVTLDKVDIDYLVSENLRALSGSRFWKESVELASRPPVFAIWPIENATTQHLDDQLLMLLSSIETSLVNSGDVRVVARSLQQELMREVDMQLDAAFDPATARSLGRQLGAQYFLTGKITSVDERLKGTRRLQYRLFLQVLEIETGLVTFQNEASRSKGLQR